MATFVNNPGTAAVFPWCDTNILAESLSKGEICLSTAMSQFAAVARECFRLMEVYSNELAKASLEHKTKVEKVEKLATDLSDKCQGLQQALLYKEEKYDEKCRELERYKVICEISAKAAINDDDMYYNDLNKVENLCDFVDRENEELDKLAQHSMINRESLETRRNNIKAHKLSQNQIHVSDYVAPLKSEDFSTQRANAFDEDYDRSDKLASYYVGGPCKRIKPISSIEASKFRQDVKLRDRLTLMGAVNVGFNKINSSQSSTSMSKPIRSGNSLVSEHQDKRMKISLTGQSNEVMSSSRNAMHQLKQKFTEKDLHRQVAGGCWTRIASRRKKDWPF